MNTFLENFTVIYSSTSMLMTVGVLMTASTLLTVVAFLSGIFSSRKAVSEVENPEVTESKENRLSRLFRRWWNSNRYPVSCVNCRRSITELRVYAGASPLITTLRCHNCGLSNEYSIEYKHAMKATCSNHAEADSCEVLHFPCKPEEVQTKRFSKSICSTLTEVRFQCHCRK